MTDAPRLTGHQYGVMDGRGGQWLVETCDQYPEPSPIGLVADLLADRAGREGADRAVRQAGRALIAARVRSAQVGKTEVSLLQESRCWDALVHALDAAEDAAKPAPDDLREKGRALADEWEDWAGQHLFNIDSEHRSVAKMTMVHVHALRALLDGEG